jgi:hypothetical protein
MTCAVFADYWLGYVSLGARQGRGLDGKQTREDNDIL